MLEHSEQGKHKLIASFEFTLTQIRQCNRFMLVKEGAQISSQAIIERYSNEPIFTWNMFLEKGLELFLDVCVDFTSSNLPPKDPRSLHYTNGGQLTLY